MDRNVPEKRTVTRRRSVQCLLGIGLVGTAGCLGDDVTGDDDSDDANGDDAAGDGNDGDGDDSAAGDSNGGGTPGDDMTLGEMRFDEAYAYEIDYPDYQSDSGDISVELAGRFHGGNYYQETRSGPQEFESYYVDGDHYVVIDGICVENPSPEEDPRGDAELGGMAETGGHSDRSDDHADLEPTGTATVDGNETFVFELDTEEEMTYYVDAASGHLRRIEIPQGTIDFHSWGRVDPVEPPEMNCL